MSVIANVQPSLPQLRDEVVARGVVAAHPIFASRAQGSRIWDVDGREYLDFVAGIGVVNVGHNHPAVLDAARRQLDAFVHTCFQVVMYEPYVELGRRLAALVPAMAPAKTFFATTGAEAVENAVKIARAATGRSAIIAFHGGFHGRTLMGMTLTGMSDPYRQTFGPFAPEVYHAPYPYEYRGWSAERALDALQQLFTTEVPANRVAAILIEPELGDGGFVPAPAAYMQRLREIATRHGIMLIVDEIQSGFGRTGKMFAFEHAGIVPDLVTVAKGLANGFPLSGVVGRAAVMDAPDPGGLGGTYGGNPVACAAALAVLDVLRDEDLLNRAARLGGILGAGLAELATRHDCIGDVRGLGTMKAIEIVTDREAKTPDANRTTAILHEARDRGLLVIRCGTHRNAVRLLPPLVTTDAEAHRALDILDHAIAASSRRTSDQSVPVR
jgi:4-aminobutyrate aminotransferase / (S)-3-amino-2-methylpropionate transaminase / 5-aminovalerate transaminase